MSVHDKRQSGWFWVHDAILDRFGKVLGPIGIAVYVCLCRFAGKERTAFPSLGKMATLIGVCKRSVQTALIRLEELKLICIIHRSREDGGSTSNVYELLDVPGDAPPVLSHTTPPSNAYHPPCYDQPGGVAPVATEGLHKEGQPFEGQPEEGTVRPDGSSTPPSGLPHGLVGKPPIQFNPDTGHFEGITERHREQWRAAFPAVDLNRELAQMESWVIAQDGGRGVKVHYIRFVFRWLAKSQDQAGRPNPFHKPSPKEILDRLEREEQERCPKHSANGSNGTPKSSGLVQPRK